MKNPLNRLHQADCIAELTKLAAKGFEVELVFADPPYNIGFSYDVYRDKRDGDEYLAWCDQWIRAASGVLSETGAFWIASGDEYVAEIKGVAEKAGLHLRNWVLWYYTFGVHCDHKFSRSHTHLMYFVKDPKRFTFNDDQIRVPSARQLVYKDGRADARGRVPDNTWILRPQDAPQAFTPDHDVWYFARVAGTFKERAGFHGCQMPERLLERIIRCCSSENDVVLDPFAGSGSTLVVAKKLGRRFLGYDISAEYARHATARIEATRVGDAIDGPEDALTSAPPTALGRGPRRVKIDEAGVLEAFQKSADGFSVDRVLADPVLSAAFIDACGQLSLAGRARDWNLALVGLRKAGQLNAATERRTQHSWKSMDPFVFASEIALQKMLALGYPSFDHVLCDPAAAVRFDDLARALAPGFRAFDYRWAALRLRKDARLWRGSAEKLPKTITNCEPVRTVLAEGNLRKLKSVPGVYLLSAARQDSPPIAYIGETRSLGERARRTLESAAALDQFLPGSGSWNFEWISLEGATEDHRRGLQSRLIGSKHPRLNYRELAAIG